MKAFRVFMLLVLGLVAFAIVGGRSSVPVPGKDRPILRKIVRLLQFASWVADEPPADNPNVFYEPAPDLVNLVRATDSRGVPMLEHGRGW